MKFDKETAIEKAKGDLASRLGVRASEISVVSATSKEFPDMSLGAPAEGEFAAQMIASGWEIRLAHNGKEYDYRGDKYQLRLRGFKGKNYLIAG
ncbi:hypothetical protein [Leptolyngbya sp. 7M]|uniref:hypothetical protein n=1 Tax=Leptolyngbya sp. 7M TaxID=2812896 RepID=UPI001B8A90F3|nr:hypothetical protein [Leptolyngbya sp. 7M]QYO65949.1 hypothetical protein JVX88_03885 [Leptolyngbya sp. 7M]